MGLGTLVYIIATAAKRLIIFKRHLLSVRISVEPLEIFILSYTLHCFCCYLSSTFLSSSDFVYHQNSPFLIGSDTLKMGPLFPFSISRAYPQYAVLEIPFPRDRILLPFALSTHYLSLFGKPYCTKMSSTELGVSLGIGIPLLVGVIAFLRYAYRQRFVPRRQSDPEIGRERSAYAYARSQHRRPSSSSHIPSSRRRDAVEDSRRSSNGADAAQRSGQAQTQPAQSSLT